MSYQKEREQFIARFMSTPEFVHIQYGERFSICLLLLRNASAEQRWNEVSCSFDIGEKETAKQERMSNRRGIRVATLAQRLGAKLDAQGDPRGNPYCLLVGPREIRLSIPARGLPARCFA